MKKNKKPTLKPLRRISFISENGVELLSEAEITHKKVGQKAFGLASIPEAWTLPFIVISGELYGQYKVANVVQREAIIKSWSAKIISVTHLFKIEENDNIIVRSSACTEGLDERGKYYSVPGNLSEIVKSLETCLNKLASDIDISDSTIPLVIQKHVVPISAQGHLSNERRFSKEKRDWIVQFEDKKNGSKSLRSINLRNWRNEIPINALSEQPLKCNLSLNVLEDLEVPASWATNRKLRLHFEWVWSGKTIYIVQADEEHEFVGEDPYKIYDDIKSYNIIKTKFKCLKPIEEKHGKQFDKIKNVLTYNHLGLHTAKLYILDDPEIIKKLAEGVMPKNLEADLRELCERELIIRTDLFTDSFITKQMLPRTDGIRSYEEAKKWLIDNSKKIIEKYTEKAAFIFHNFIPAFASAFAFAAPNEKRVRVEALWGLPEGLYYYAHDKYTIDTNTVTIDSFKKPFKFIKKAYHKKFFISPNENGQWVVKKLKAPFDWGLTIKSETLLRKIAIESRKIAERVKYPVSIMWFIDAEIGIGQRESFPWYHEKVELNRINTKINQRRKTPFDKTLNIRNSDDIDILKNEVAKGQTNIKTVKIQLQEEKLLREKDTLKKIGELCHKINAIIILEGGVLSHAYYQLVETNANVEVVHPFDEYENKREYNKLVRDKVSDNIQESGEIVHKAKLTGESLSRFLREKLVEESFETLDAIDKDQIVAELADVSEVIDAILLHMKVSKKELKKIQDQKRLKTGGFKEGVILLSTQNPPLVEKSKLKSDSLFNETQQDNRGFIQIDDRLLLALSHNIDKSTDKRTHQAANETILKLTIPLVSEGWSATSTEIDNEISSSDIKARITGKRIGPKLQIELSLYSDTIQLNLPFSN